MTMAKLSGVLFGINKYHNAPLRGCVNDVIIMRDILVKKYGVQAPNLRLVLDERATMANMLERMEWLVTNEVPNKFLHYSGHGAWLPVKSYVNNDEPDGKDELLCPYDFNWDTHYILDNKIDEILSKMNPDHHMTMVFDCCHSGTIDRDFTMNKPRQMEPPLDIRSRFTGEVLSREILAFPEEGSKITYDLEEAFEELIMADEKKAPAKPKKFSRHNVSIITGCRDDQTSSDAYLNGRFQGALSYVIQGLILKNPKITLKELRDQAETKLRQYGFSQVPQLSCSEENLNKPFIQV